MTVLERAARQAGYRLEPSQFLSPRTVRDHISRRKRLGLEPGATLNTVDAPWINDILSVLDESYSHLLREEGLLDFDDLIGRSITLLREAPETATAIRRRLRFLCVDEFHDVSADQYALIRELAPPGRGAPGRHDTESVDLPSARVMVVADPDQAIFSWRGAEPGTILPRFERDYRPLSFSLTDNFRSTRTIVRVANHIRSQSRTRPLTSALADDGPPIFCLKYPDTHSEAEDLARLIKRALGQGNYHNYDDIAVLYPLHKRADDAELALLRHGIPVRRTRPGRFFDDPDVQDVLRHLDLIATLAEPAFEPALNWPHVVVDEVTMIHLRRQAKSAGMKLAEFAQSPLLDSSLISPLTRTTIRRFLADIVASLQPMASGPADRLVMELLSLLERRRSPVPQADRQTFSGFLAFLGKPLREHAEQLQDAIEQGCPIALVPAPTLDALAAAAILAYTLGEYFGHPVQIGYDHHAAPAMPIHLGVPAPATGRSVCLSVRKSGGMEYGLALQAWRLAQMLLMGKETLDQGRFVVLDVETGSLDVNRTEIVEVAAIRVEHGRVSDTMLTSLVRPTHRDALTYEASQVTGITWNDVRDAPEPEQIVPALLAFIGDDTIVGHNLLEFDLPILARYARRFGATLDNPTLDMRKLAMRLLPDATYDLASLAKRFSLPCQPKHRAPVDATATAHLFLRLLEELRNDRVVDVLSELLPVVALASHDQGAPDRDEFALVFEAAARADGSRAAHQAFATLEAIAGPTHAEQARAWLRSRPRTSNGDEERWQRLRAGWQEALEQFRASAGDESLVSLLTYARLATSMDLGVEGDGRVTMMSLHAAKGREWPLVFLIGLEEGVLPFSAASEDALEEAKRCFYVGITRAKRQVVITWSAHALGRPRAPSRFLAGLPADAVRHRERSAGST
jgi:superfamily I DNA/RNA helicase